MKKKDLRATWPQALGTLLAPVAAVLVIRWLFIEPFVIPSESMLPTLLVHDHIFANKFVYGIRFPFGNGFLLRWGTPKRGDIIVFKYPKNPDVYYIKRTIGLPGDKMQMQDGKEVIVPPDHLFMMGDNREHSSDSRVWGFLPIKNVVGRASFIWLSCDETLLTEKMICNPQTIRWQRMFKGIE